MKITDEMIEAAQKLTNCFAEQDIKEWKLLGVQNRIDDTKLTEADKLLEVMGEVCSFMANFDGRNNNSHLKEIAKDALAQYQLYKAGRE